MSTDLESILALSVEVREKESKAREGRMGDRPGLCPWDRSGDWDGSDDGVRWWQRCGIVGLDRCCESIYQSELFSMIYHFMWTGE